VAHEVAVLGLKFERRRPVPREYKGTTLDQSVGRLPAAGRKAFEV